MAWNPLPSAVPVAADDSSVSGSATVIEDERVPEPVDNPPDSDLSADLPIEPISDKVHAADPVEPVSDKLPVDPVLTPVTATAATAPFPWTAIKTSGVSIASATKLTPKMYCSRVVKLLPCTEPPDFDKVTGKEWDTRARAYIRHRVETMIQTKEIGLLNKDFITWTEDDLHSIGKVFCKILCIHNYLVDYVHGLLKCIWNKRKQR